jgi:hypothetical protein
VSDRDAADKVATMRDAVAELVRDGDTLAIEGSQGRRRCHRKGNGSGFESLAVALVEPLLEDDRRALIAHALLVERHRQRTGVVGGQH